MGHSYDCVGILLQNGTGQSAQFIWRGIEPRRQGQQVRIELLRALTLALRFRQSLFIGALPTAVGLRLCVCLRRVGQAGRFSDDGPGILAQRQVKANGRG
ncbi:hypothetical protein CDN98_09580 [Roseateles terrae]|nr:hypothetical protein CDN98_09580 [Roseateles terrae]